MLFELPLWERFIRISKHGFCRKYMELDGVGFELQYDSKEELKQIEDDPTLIRCCIAGRKQTSALIEAESKEEAINKFHAEWDGAKIGGTKSKESKALWINTEKEIIAIRDCPIRHQNKRGWYACGKPNEEDSGNGEYGMCAVDPGYDLPSGPCPLREPEELVA